MAESPPMLTQRGLVIFRNLLMAIIVILMFSVGFWMLNQVLDSVVILGRNYVDVPGYPAQVGVWVYHDIAYALLWGAYLVMILWEIAPWKPGLLTTGRVLIALLGFSLLTSGLWFAQDLMNAVLVLHRSFVDMPFLVASLDLYETRSVVTLLTGLSFVGFYSLIRVSRAE